MTRALPATATATAAARVGSVGVGVRRGCEREAEVSRLDSTLLSM